MFGRLGFNSINRFLNICYGQEREGENGGDGREGKNTKMNRRCGSFLPRDSKSTKSKQNS